MSYEALRERLQQYYLKDCTKNCETFRDKVYPILDEWDKTHPGKNVYELKAAQYRVIAESETPVLFDDLPFYYEMGTVASFGDGHYGRGGRHANGWLAERNNHLCIDQSPERWRLYSQNRADKLYLTCGPYFDYEHTPLPFDKIFRVGLSGVCDEANAALSECTNEEEYSFVSAAMAGLEAMHLMADKFAAAAKERLLTETNPDYIRQLTRIAETASRVPWNPPQNFYEGLCTFAFMRKAIGSIEGYGFNSMGRPDILLKPLYEKSLSEGVTDSEMYDDLCRFLLIWDSHVDRTRKMTGYSEYEYENSITIGGVDRDGKPVYNRITEMFVTAELELDCLYPKLMCRFGTESPEEYLRLIGRPLLKGKNIFLFQNDDTMIPAYLDAGYAIEDARDYVVTGCWGVAIGDLNKQSDGEYLNLLRAMEWGIHMPTEKLAANHLTFHALEEAIDFEEVYRFYIDNVSQIIRMKADLNAVGGRIQSKVCPLCVTSALMRNPLKNRKDISAGGTGYAKENMSFAGFPDVIDSLLAIKTLCFDRKICTLPELAEACRQNWTNETLRLEATHCPAYGDGSEESMSLAARLNADLYRLTRGLPTVFGGGEYKIGHFMYTEVIWWGKDTLATPNGRPNGYYIAHGLTPTRLHEIASITDVLRSVSALKLDKCSSNSIINVILPASKLDDTQLAGLIRACAEMGVQAIQINCVNREDLLLAQKDPEHYRHIVVRVTGFSCPFVMLSEQWQEEVLSRNYYS